MPTTLEPTAGSGTDAPVEAAAKSVAYFFYFFIGLGVAILWTLAGSAIAFIQGDFARFSIEWQSMQGFFLIGLGVWLVLIARSGALSDRTFKIIKGDSKRVLGITDRRLRVLTVLLIGVVGTASLVGMGFSASGVTLFFMWGTCAAICFAAGFVTLHTADLLSVVHHLQTVEIKTFQYSPARTPGLRHLINYFTSFTLILSIGYSFSFVGTLKGHWTGPPTYVEAVQLFWPLIYVPVCSVALIYPHFVMHKVIQKAKERTLVFYQHEIDGLLANYPSLDDKQVQRVNTLAQLFDRISATPDYVIDLGIAIRTCLPLVFNVAILLAKPLLGQS